jgi:hypothetical protein
MEDSDFFKVFKHKLPSNIISCVLYFTKIGFYLLLLVVAAAAAVAM